MYDIKAKDKQEYRRLLEEIGEGYCKAGTYCIFKEFLIAAYPSRRLLVQLKAVDKFKYLESEKAGSDIGWQKAMELWVSEGHATDFSEAYGDDRSFNDIFRLTMKIRPASS